MNGKAPGPTVSTISLNEHLCEFPELIIEEADKDDNLQPGMKVLIPCPVCGETPLDHVEWMEARQKELQDSILAVKPFRPLYHWSPIARRKQIERYGLRPSMRPVSSQLAGYRATYVCFADSPSWAWALSGAMKWPPKGEWDLWMTYLDHLKEPQVLGAPDRETGIYEIRTDHRVYKRDLWYVGSRTKD